MEPHDEEQGKGDLHGVVEHELLHSSLFGEKVRNFAYQRNLGSEMGTK